MQKHVVLACNACRKRKVKCVGNPCAYCLKKNYMCEFKDSNKKRGPKVKLPTQQPEVMCHMQEAMSNLSMQQDYVEFYFQCIGIPIPKMYKEHFFSPTESYSELRTQLYIIMAEIMKAYGNKDQETLYINKAYKSSSLFENDTLESAISMIMMANYLGNSLPKARNLILMAQNTLQLPTIKSSELLLHTKMACESLCTIYNPTVSKQQRATYILSGLIELDLSTMITSVSEVDIITVGFACITNLLFLKGNFDVSTVSTTLESASVSSLNEGDRKYILDYIHKFENVVTTLPNMNSKLEIYALFNIQYFKFIVEWRSGNVPIAFQAALDTAEMFKANSHVIALRLNGGILQLLLLPYYLRECGKLEETNQLLFSMENAFENIGKQEKFRRFWEEMCGTLQDYNIVQLEADLLGNFSNSLVQLHTVI